MVMATGIVSLAAQFMAMPAVARALFYLNIGLYAILWVLNIIRVSRYPRHVFNDLIDHLRGPGFFTVVAGTSILGSQAIILWSDYGLGRALWILAVILWVSLTYTIFAALTVKVDKPSLDRGINGGWLLAVVATQTIAVLSALLATHADAHYRLELNFLALSMWLWGGMLYIWMMALIFYRYTFFRLSPGDLAPPYWINMGAMAISTLAGSLLINNAATAPYLTLLLPFLKGFTILYWATASWWIPMLLVLGVWRYVYKRFPLRYDPLYWGAVFPLGMYAACTFQMDVAMQFGFFSFISKAFFAVALLAWSAAFLGLAWELVSKRLASLL
jgi:tellurite resistance protein TehA-like permease